MLAHLKRRCRRCVPAPDVLERRVQEVYDKYSGAVDPATGLGLFTGAMQDVMESTLKLIRKGAISGERLGRQGCRAAAAACSPACPGR